VLKWHGTGVTAACNGPDSTLIWVRVQSGSQVQVCSLGFCKGLCLSGAGGVGFVGAQARGEDKQHLHDGR
jgi:hypothetical protein